VLQPPHVLEYNLMRGPLPYKDNRLMFVVMRLTNHPKGTKVADLPTSLTAKFEAVFGMSAQQFRGYLFNTEKGGFNKVGPACCWSREKLSSRAKRYRLCFFLTVHCQE
jgi:hypothetical protein